METSTLHISAPFRDKQLSFGDKLPLDVYYYHTNFQKKIVFICLFYSSHREGYFRRVKYEKKLL